MTVRSTVSALMRGRFANDARRQAPQVPLVCAAVDTMDEDSFHILYGRTAAPLRAYVVRVLGSVTQADDIVQESYLRLLRQPTADQDLQRLRARLFRIASNLMIDHWRSLKHEAHAGADIEPSASAPDLPLRIDMERVFRRLSPQQRQMMWLAYVEGAEHREIAAALGLREGSVKVLLSRVRRKLLGLLRGPSSGQGQDR
jgi:RNA polymerase sigma-70 factor (ECF subfamily)